MHPHTQMAPDPLNWSAIKPDVKAVLKVNENWWDTPQHNLTRIEFTPISSDATRVAALLSGQIDMMYPAPLQDIKRIESASGSRYSRNRPCVSSC